MTLIRANSNYFPSFSSLFDDFFNTELGDWRRNNFSSENSTLPKVNVKEDENGFTIEVAAPGMEKEDFNVQLNHNHLTISSEKRSENTEEAEKYTKKEFAYHSFQRSFSLPNSANGEKISAKYDKGILTLSIPKREEAKPKPVKKISIN